ncbi:hypothetical protein NBRC3293_1285 [Gluconobacter oxydans NBRC 3293]|uniref:Transposase n=1 Tax=Gluconobacter oxydans NBRC 3293 TaxID=1315969 RepID=A0A829WIY8_GLUOY|nr:hypothetical protein NBRC3293_1285 [Gluconobacter oxydans NBRC 3293]
MPVRQSGLVYHSDCDSQYVVIRYVERLAESGIETDKSFVNVT